MFKPGNQLTFLVSTFVFLLLLSLYTLNPNYTPSPAALLANALYDRFPGVPKNEAEATIRWINPPLEFFGFEYDNLDQSLPPIGSRSWLHLYPSPSQTGPKPRRQWVRRLNWLKKTSSDPLLSRALSIPQAKLEPDGYVSYPSDVDLGSGDNGACNWERSGCLVTQDNGYHQDFDIVDGDKDNWVVNFDDG